MNINEINRINYRLDNSKYELHEKGVTFDFVAIMPDGTTLHTGIGTGGQMCELTLIRMADLFRITDGAVTVEQFADSVKKNIIKWLEDNPVVFGDMNVLPNS